MAAVTSLAPRRTAPLAVETIDGTTYIDIGDIQIAAGPGGVLVTCPPHLLPEAAAAVASPVVRAILAEATTAALSPAA